MTFQISARENNNRQTKFREKKEIITENENNVNLFLTLERGILKECQCFRKFIE